jgi:hypothetical protein
MDDMWIYFLFFVGWIALQRWILPRFGIPTCMSGACRVPVKNTKQAQEPKSEKSRQTSGPTV